MAHVKQDELMVGVACRLVQCYWFHWSLSHW